jgi:hypothetical protein
VVHEETGGTSTGEIPLTYFFRLAQQAAEPSRTNGMLKAGERFRYVVTAFPTQPVDQQPERIHTERFAVEAVRQPLQLHPLSLATLATQAQPYGQLHSEEYPVFLPASVLDEIVVLKQQAGSTETGGILIGHLHHDRSLPELFAEVTAQIPARHTQADAMHLTFTAETWTDVQSAVTLRHCNEIMLGWWHTHPVHAWCKCPRERQQHCPLATEFFSDEDDALHRTVFPRAYSVGLVLSDVPAVTETWTTSWALFGWREGLVQARGFSVCGGFTPPAAGITASTVEGV